jgi:hypothetical protein
MDKCTVERRHSHGGFREEAAPGASLGLETLREKIH